MRVGNTKAQNLLIKMSIYAWYMLRIIVARLLKKEIVYVSGPITNQSRYDVKRWFATGVAAAKNKKYWSFNPSKLGDWYVTDHNGYMRICIFMLTHSKYIYVVGTPRAIGCSKGVNIERYLAMVLDKKEITLYEHN